MVHGCGCESDQVQIAVFIKGVGPFRVGIDIIPGQGTEKSGQRVFLRIGQVELLARPRPRRAGRYAAQFGIQVGIGRINGDLVVMIDHLPDGLKASVVHERAVQLSVGIEKIPERGRFGVGQVNGIRIAGDADDSVVQAKGVDIEFRGPVASLTACATLGRRRQKNGFTLVFLRGEIRERRAVVGRDRPAGIKPGIKGLDAPDKLCQRLLNPGFRDSGVAVNQREKTRVVGNPLHFPDQGIQTRLTVLSAEAHFHGILDGAGCLVLK